MAYAKNVIATCRRARLDPKAMGYRDDLVIALFGKSLTDNVKDYEDPEDS